MPFLLAATWKTAMPEVERSYHLFAARRISAEDAVERVCMHVEDDEDENSVGYGGLPNSAGEMELDGAFMEGRALRIGAVGALRGFRHPVSVARRVMTDTEHNLIAGEGARILAEKWGFEQRDMLSPTAKAAYDKHLTDIAEGEANHDTVCVIALDGEGHFAIGASTSGVRYKLPGRLSDTILPGCGFYCDDELGAAAATGLGEDIMRGTLAIKALMYHKAGYDPAAATAQAIADLINRVEPCGDVAVMLVSRDGRLGGADNHGRFTMSSAGGLLPIGIYPAQHIKPNT